MEIYKSAFTVLFPETNAETKNVVAMWLKSYGSIQECAQQTFALDYGCCLPVYPVSRANATREKVYKLLQLFYTTKQSARAYFSKPHSVHVPRQIKMNGKAHYTLYRSQTKPYSFKHGDNIHVDRIEGTDVFALKQFMSTVLQDNHLGKFGVYNYTVYIPLDTPIVVVSVPGLNGEEFTEVLLPPGFVALNEPQTTLQYVIPMFDKSAQNTFCKHKFQDIEVILMNSHLQQQHVQTQHKSTYKTEADDEDSNFGD
jgi:hypothetical protein